VNISLKTYFKELQSTLGTSTKSETTTTDKTAETSTLDLSKVGTLYFVDGTKADKLKTTIDGYTRKNNEIKKQVYEYLNAGKISALQEYVYKQNAANGTKDTMNSRYNKRDGYLGPKTLTGIKNVAAIDTPMDISKIDNPATITYTPVKNKTETVNVMKITKDIVLQNEPELYNLKINAAEDDREPMSGYTRVNHDADPTDYSVILKTIADSPESYHLDFKNGNYQPAEGYQRIDETDLTNYWVISNEIVAAPATYNLIPNAN
jgi:glutamate mutase epsilon subunit